MIATVASPADVAALPGEGAPQGAAPAAPGGDFAAALLLAASAAPETAASDALPLDALLAPSDGDAAAPEGEGGDDALAAAFAALPELLARLALAPAAEEPVAGAAPVDVLAPATAQADAAPVGGIEMAAPGPADTSDDTAAPVAVDPLAPVPAEAAPAAPVDADPVAVVPDASAVAVAQPAGAARQASPPVVITDVSAAPAGADVPMEGSSIEGETPPPAVDDGGGGTAPPADGTADSVVRFVGNAGQQKPDGEPAGGGNNHSDPQPNASLQGVAPANGRPPAAEVQAPADASTAASAETDAQLPPPVQQVRQAVLERVEAGGGEAIIRLDPPELGTVHIHVRISGEAVHLSVEADHSGAAQLLRQHAQDLSGLLGSHGLNLGDVYVGLGNGNAGDPRGSAAEQQGRGHANPGEFASIFEAGAPEATARHNRLRAAYNPDGRHLYRV